MALFLYFFALFTLKSVLILALFAFCKRVSYKLVSYEKKAHVPVYCKEPPPPPHACLPKQKSLMVLSETMCIVAFNNTNLFTRVRYWRCGCVKSLPSAMEWPYSYRITCNAVAAQLSDNSDIRYLCGHSIAQTSDITF